MCHFLLNTLHVSLYEDVHQDLAAFHTGGPLFPVGLSHRGAHLNLSLELRRVLRRPPVSVLLDGQQQRLQARSHVHPVEQHRLWR